MTVNCDQARAQLQNRLDGRIPSGASASLAAHLKTCAGCRRQAALLAFAVSGVARLSQKRPSAGFDGRVLAAAAAARRRAAPSKAAAWALNAAVSATALWTAALAAFARPRLSVPATVNVLHVLRHPAASLAAAELRLAQAGLSLPEALRAARHAGAVLSRIHYVPGSVISDLPLQFAAAAVIAGLAVVAAVKPRAQFAAPRRIR